jgi:hypothetical protein
VVAFGGAHWARAVRCQPGRSCTIAESGVCIASSGPCVTACHPTSATAALLALKEARPVSREHAAGFP